MSYSWAGRRSGVPPNSSSQQKLHVEEIMPFSNHLPVLWSRYGVCIIRPARRTIFHTQEGSMVETYLPGGREGFSKDNEQRKVGPKNRGTYLLCISVLITCSESQTSKSRPGFCSTRFSAVDDAAQKASGNLIILQPPSYCT